MIILTELSPSKSSTVTGHSSDNHETKLLTREEILQSISKKRWNMTTGDMVEFPPLNCKDDLAAWIARVEEDLIMLDIPRSQWADAAIIYLPVTGGYESLGAVMRLQRARRMETSGLDIWIWEDFQESLSQVLGKVSIQRLDLDFFFCI